MSFSSSRLPTFPKYLPEQTCMITKLNNTCESFMKWLCKLSYLNTKHPQISHRPKPLLILAKYFQGLKLRSSKAKYSKCWVVQMAARQPSWSTVSNKPNSKTFSPLYLHQAITVWINTRNSWMKVTLHSLSLNNLVTWACSFIVSETRFWNKSRRQISISWWSIHFRKSNMKTNSRSLTAVKSLEDCWIISVLGRNVPLFTLIGSIGLYLTHSIKRTVTDPSAKIVRNGMAGQTRTLL